MLTILYKEGTKGFGKFVQLRRWELEQGTQSDVVLEYSNYRIAHDSYGDPAGIKSEAVPDTFERLEPSMQDPELIRYAIKKFDEMPKGE